MSEAKAEIKAEDVATPEVAGGGEAAVADSKKRKAEDEVETPVPANAKHIIKQIEFYFGDSNLMKPDKHLVAKIAENEDGWVQIAHLASFKRMKQLVPDSNPQSIASAVRSSANDIVEVSDCGENVRRSATCPLPDKYEYHQKCIYTKGFDLEGTTIDTVAEYFTGKGFEPTSVRLRFTLTDKEFKGSAFVEMADVATARKCTEEKFELANGNTLVVEMKESYLLRKKAERVERKKSQKSEKQAAKAAKGGDAEGGAGGAAEPAKVEVKEGCVISLSGLTEGTSFNDIKEVFNKYAQVKYVDFNRGETAGFVRFASADAKAAKDKMEENKELIKDATPVITVLEGEEEKAYWDKFTADMAASRKRKADGEDEPADDAPIVTGCVLAYRGLTDETSREDIKDCFNKYSEVQWVDFQRGDTEGHARFSAADAQKVKDECEANKDEILAKVPELRVLEGDEENEYWAKMRAGQRERRNKFSKGRGRGGGRGRGRGRGGGRGGGRWKKRRT